MGIPTPFSLRTTTAICVFNCLFIASPQGAQQFVFGNGAVIGALQLSYAQLVTLYAELRQQSVANEEVVLDGLIASAITTVMGLQSTIDAMMESGDAGFVLAGMQLVVKNALTNLNAAQGDEGVLVD